MERCPYCLATPCPYTGMCQQDGSAHERALDRKVAEVDAAWAMR